jgi:hypothetical protein
MKKQIVKFLDYSIENTGNGDGWVISKPKGKDYECNLGNFNELNTAKKQAMMFFMIARPEIFSHSLVNRTLYGIKSGFLIATLSMPNIISNLKS